MSGDIMAAYAPDRVVVHFSPEAMTKAAAVLSTEKGAIAPGARTGIASVDAILDEVGATRLECFMGEMPNKAASAGLGMERWFLVDVPKGTDIFDLADRLQTDGNIEEALPDYAVFTTSVPPNDPLYPDHWGHNNTGQLPSYNWNTHTQNGPPVGTIGFDANAELAWGMPQGYGDANVIIAIIDTGVDTAHPDLDLVAGYDYGDNNSNPDDNSPGVAGHGTACAGIASAVANNGLGIVGIAGHSRIMPLKISDSSGSMTLTAATNAVNHAANNGADVISMSFGAAISSYGPMDSAMQYAFNSGLVLLAATGNSNSSTIFYPANNQHVIAVGAASPCGDRKRSSSNPNHVNPGVNTDPNSFTCDGQRWWGSSYGVNTPNHAGAVDVLAPTILPTTDISGSAGYQPGDYEPFFNGTSCSSPYAAGVAALIKAANPSWTPAQIRTQLRDTATDIVNVESGPGWDRYSGYGMVDAYAAVGGGAPVAPVADFTSDVSSGCAPQTVQFTDQSSGTITNWSWTFSDGGTSSQQNPTHTYTAAGVYTISLTVSGPAGSDTHTVSDMITIGVAPQADFSATPLDGIFPLTVSFTDLSTGDPTQWGWDFGDSFTSNEQNPVHNYQTPGTYTVILGVTNNCGYDQESKMHYITVNAPPPPVAAFTAEATSGCAPLDVRFTDTSTGDIDEWHWDFGDGQTSHEQHPLHQFMPGLWTVTLTVTGPGGVDEQVMADYIQVLDLPMADFSASETTGIAPLTVDFTDISVGATAWAWDFGGDGTSSDQNPSHTFSAAGTYAVQLVASNECGADTTSLDITVEAPAAPVAAFSAEPLGGCAPLEIEFNDESTGQIDSWSWDFGDGGTSSQQNPGHTYTGTGTFTVSLTVEGPGGSDTKTVSEMVTVASSPTAAFSASQTSGIAPLTVDFTDESSGAPTSWAWDFGGDGTSSDRNPSHTFSAAGTYLVQLVTSNECGADTTSLDITVEAPAAPVAAFSAEPLSGCAPLEVVFIDESAGQIDHWSWGFGDASSDTARSPVHTYAAPGSYDVRLIVFGPGGADTLTVAGLVTVADLVQADFEVDVTEGPSPLTVEFTDLSTGGPVSWLWDFGDGATDTLQNPTHAYTADGTYTVSLTSSGPCGSDVMIQTDLIVVLTPSDVGDQAHAVFGLRQNYPNPFNPMTTVVFSLSKTSHARLKIFDAAGRLVDVLVDDQRGPGEHRVTWQPNNVPSGIYFVRFTAEGRTETRRMMLVR